MGLLDRLRGAPGEQPWRAPLPGMCRCAEHVDALTGMVIESTPRVRVGDLLDADAVTVDESPEHYLYGEATGQRRGPFHWRLTYSPTVQRLYDDEAPAQIDDMLYIQSGIDNVLRIGDSTLAVGASDLCAGGVMAAFVKALANPRVRLDA